MVDLHGNRFFMHRNWLPGLLLVTLCLGACQSPKPARSQITDPNTVFAQGGAQAVSGGTPSRGGGGGGRRNRGQSQGVNATGVSD
jgi:hypothetical protein